MKRALTSIAMVAVVIVVGACNLPTQPPGAKSGGQMCMNPPIMHTIYMNATVIAHRAGQIPNAVDILIDGEDQHGGKGVNADCGGLPLPYSVPDAVTPWRYPVSYQVGEVVHITMTVTYKYGIKDDGVRCWISNVPSAGVDKDGNITNRAATLDSNWGFVARTGELATCIVEATVGAP